MPPYPHPSLDSLLAQLDQVRQSPQDRGTVLLITRRPQTGQREILDEAELDCDEGLRGDSWRARGSRHTPDGSADPEDQVTLMSARVAALFAADPEGWALTGDQLYIDLDLSQANLPPGSRLHLGTAILEVTSKPHTGCYKFAGHFGQDAVRFINHKDYRDLRLRGVNARVVQGGTVKTGDLVTVQRPQEEANNLQPDGEIKS